MADELRMALQDLLRKSELGDPAFLREGVRVLAQELMELEVSQHLGAEWSCLGSVDRLQLRGGRSLVAPPVGAGGRGRTGACGPPRVNPLTGVLHCARRLAPLRPPRR